jgi:hypothetical protein
MKIKLLPAFALLCCVLSLQPPAAHAQTHAQSCAATLARLQMAVQKWTMTMQMMSTMQQDIDDVLKSVKQQKTDFVAGAPSAELQKAAADGATLEKQLASAKLSFERVQAEMQRAQEAYMANCP